MCAPPLLPPPQGYGPCRFNGTAVSSTPPTTLVEQGYLISLGSNQFSCASQQVRGPGAGWEEACTHTGGAGLLAGWEEACMHTWEGGRLGGGMHTLGRQAGRRHVSWGVRLGGGMHARWGSRLEGGMHAH